VDGECATECEEINSEVGSLCAEVPHGRQDVPGSLRYRREARDRIGCATSSTSKVSDDDAERFRQMDNPAIVNEIYEIAKLAAAKQVKAGALAGRDARHS